jgi:hypothetical protein
MRDTIILVLIIAVASLGYLMHSQNRVLSDQQRQIRDLNVKLEAKYKSAGLELQAQCAKQAALVYKDSGWEKASIAGYENHYNEKLNKCFVAMQNTDVKTSAGRLTTSRFLVDAFEGKTLGTYFWQSAKNTPYGEVPPFECDVTISSGEKKVCHSSDEFEELLKVYMQ